MSESQTLDIAAIRRDYMGEPLDEARAARDPLEQFRTWFDDAVRAKLPMVNAMTLATATRDAQPSARMVLLKGVDRGFVFYTDYDSRKGAELDATKRAAAVFYWIELERQIRIEGIVERTSEKESDDYFTSRPLGSRIACSASTQSAIVADRASLERRYAEVEGRCGQSPERPANWGGYRIIPHAVEFWQGRPNRLHDRLLYTRSGTSWKIVRLAP